ncbi:VOC family protein [Amylibacter sp. SFDW26]|uniref:VOC family protein n=1 Tax=Amylibacter sp. SFDW26 TaxID=2652722 RepID=UPI001261654F|nr:VOC family protein [Amylibacter sp. SFDW26]KAB7615281.1 VOC family protein [Amylibacter sp. SFDW26]
MDLETVSPGGFGKSLTGLGVNLLTQDVKKLAAFLTGTFDATVHRLSDDFAIIKLGDTMIQLHHDATYRTHPVQGMLPDNPPRGAGVQLYLFGIDPDQAIAKAAENGGTVIEEPRNKPHGLYEGTILSPEGYAFSPAIPEKV